MNKGNQTLNTREKENNDQNFSDIPLDDAVPITGEFQPSSSSSYLYMRSEIIHNDGPYDGAYDFSTKTDNSDKE